MRLYHGSDSIVEHPEYGRGKDDNDYGSGFYLTEDIEKANMWASVNGRETAYCNAYELDTDNLDILHLDECGTLAWIAEVLSHRGCDDENLQDYAEKIAEYYKPDTKNADVIIGYRADDSYTQVIDAFLANQLTADEVERFFHKGNLGEQVCIKSRKAFGTIRFTGYERVRNQEQYQNYDLQARQEVQSFLNNRRHAIQV